MANWWKLPYSLYAIVILFILFIPLILVYAVIKLFFNHKRQQYWVHKVNRVIFVIWSALTGFRYKIRGVENIVEGQSYIVVCNHTNLTDFMASAYALQIPGKPLVKKELLKIPVFGPLFAMASVPVDRGSDEGRKKSMDVMRKELSEGVSLIIFAEGTRNRTPQPLKEFHNGAFILSQETGVPILPVVFTNIKHLSSAESTLIRPWTIESTHLAPVYPDQYPDVQTYKQAVHKIMWNFLVENDVNFKNFEHL